LYFPLPMRTYTRRRAPFLAWQRTAKLHDIFGE
jgi:hypothetical protein